MYKFGKTKTAFKKALCLKAFLAIKQIFMAEFLLLFVSLIYFLQNNDKILIVNSSGWLILTF